MTLSIDELLSSAEARPRPHRDVDVYLDTGASERLAALYAELEALQEDADQRLGGNPREAELQAEIEAATKAGASSLLTLRFTRMIGEDWVSICSRHPMQPDVGVDRLYGYHAHGVCRDAAVECGGRVLHAEDGTETVETMDESQWARLFALLSGRDFNLIADAVFGLNEYGPAQEVEEAKKAFSGPTGSTSA